MNNQKNINDKVNHKRLTFNEQYEVFIKDYQG